MPTEEEIKNLAYSLWEQEGKPDGKDWEHYFTAKRILEEKEAAQARSTRPTPSTTTRRPAKLSFSPKRETKK